MSEVSTEFGAVRKLTIAEIQTLQSEGFEFQLLPDGKLEATDGRKQRKLDRRVFEIVKPGVTQQAVQSVPTVSDKTVEQIADVSEVPMSETIEVDARMWHKMVKSMVTGAYRTYIQVPGMRQFGQMRGAKTYEQEKAFWAETQEYLIKNP